MNKSIKLNELNAILDDFRIQEIKRLKENTLDLSINNNDFDLFYLFSKIKANSFSESIFEIIRYKNLYLSETGSDLINIKTIKNKEEQVKYSKSMKNDNIDFSIIIKKNKKNKSLSYIRDNEYIKYIKQINKENYYHFESFKINLITSRFLEYKEEPRFFLFLRQMFKREFTEIINLIDRLTIINGVYFLDLIYDFKVKITIRIDENGLFIDYIGNKFIDKKIDLDNHDLLFYIDREQGFL